jgi:hypothetical protein
LNQQGRHALSPLKWVVQVIGPFLLNEYPVYTWQFMP